MARWLLCSAAFGLLFLTTVPAHAVEWTIDDDGEYERRFQLDVTFSAHPGGYVDDSIGGEVWAGIPVLHQGFLGGINDSLHVEFGFVLATNFWRERGKFVGLSPLAGVRWNFHLTEIWDVFATVKFGGGIGPKDEVPRFAWDIGVGGYMHLSESLYLRLELAPYHLVRGGVAFLF